MIVLEAAVRVAACLFKNWKVRIPPGAWLFSFSFPFHTSFIMRIVLNQAPQGGASLLLMRSSKKLRAVRRGAKQAKIKTDWA